MTSLERTVRQARRRLWLNRWLVVLGWSAVAAAGLYVLVILPDKLFSVIEYEWFYPAAGLAAVAAGLLASVVWLWRTRENDREAATALDVAAGLRERISSGLYCAGNDDAFARAVVTDAERVGASITPRVHLPVRPPRSAAYGGVATALAALLTLLLPSMDLLGRQQQRAEAAQQAQRAAQTREVVRTTVVEPIRKLAQDNPLLAKMEGLKELDDMLVPTADSPLDARQEALKGLDRLIDKVQNDPTLADQGRLSETQKMLRRVTDLARSQDGLAQGLSDALSQGDFAAAAAALKDIQKKLDSATSTPEQKAEAEKLKQQLKETADRLEKIAESQRLDPKVAEQLNKAGVSAKDVEKNLANLSQEDLRKLAEQLAKNGLSKKDVEKITKKLEDQQSACKSCKGLGQGLNKMAGSPNGTNPGSNGSDGNQAAGLAAAGEQLSDLEKLQQEVQAAQAAMSELNNAKNALTQSCSQCGGSGEVNGQPCPDCQGSGMGQSPSPSPGQQAGNGRGGGMGQQGVGAGGLARKSETDTRFKTERTHVFTGPGSLIGQTWVNGEQVKGEASSAVVDTIMSERPRVAESIRNETMPRQYHRATGKYFDHMAKDVAGAGTTSDTASDAASTEH